ncbi:hypothetical protein T492DRAFT_840925 [Pavlovales sp. CCMP2436]|nr:hypothetical protein T492DRAFT_840925 [Pavlovales sp. CCMP2436]
MLSREEVRRREDTVPSRDQVCSLRKLVKAGDSVAQSFGAMYHFGDLGLSRDYGEALRLYNLSAAQGGAHGQVALAFIHHCGNGEGGPGSMPEDPDEGARLFALAAAQGNHVAQY